MTACPHPSSGCHRCECDAYQDGADHVDLAELECVCGCDRVVVKGEVESCLGCEVTT